MSACVGEPVSWLRLELYGLGELPDADRREVQQHLAACPLCSACLSRIETDDVVPLPLPAAKPAPRVRSRSQSWFGWSVWLGMASAAAVALLLLVRPQPEATWPGSQLRTKGGDYALELVRLDNTGKQQDPSRYSAGDRWKALLTCPPPFVGRAELVVYQDGRAYFPLDAQVIEQCGNRRTLPGAFQLDGGSPVSVCVAFSQTDMQLRARLARGLNQLPKLSVCVRVEAGSPKP